MAEFLSITTDLYGRRVAGDAKLHGQLRNILDVGIGIGVAVGIGIRNHD